MSEKTRDNPRNFGILGRYAAAAAAASGCGFEIVLLLLLLRCLLLFPAAG